MGTLRRHEARVFTAPDADDRASRRRRRRTVDAIAAHAETLTGVYEAEYFASSLIGQLWECRGRAPALEGVDPEVVVLGPLLHDLREHESVGARLTIHAIGRLLGDAVATLCDPADDGELPPWSEQIGRSRVIAAGADRAPGAGEAIVLEVRGAGMIDHAVAVFVDERLGGIAKHLGLLHPEAQRPADVGAPYLGVDDVAAACARVREALSRTDADPEAPVGERFADLRAIAIARTRPSRPDPVSVSWLN